MRCTCQNHPKTVVARPKFIVRQILLLNTADMRNVVSDAVLDTFSSTFHLLSGKSTSLRPPSAAKQQSNQRHLRVEERSSAFATQPNNGVAQSHVSLDPASGRSTLTMCIPCCLRRETSCFLRHRSSSSIAASRGPRNLAVISSAGREAVDFVAVVERAAPHKECCNIRYHAFVKAPLLRSLATRRTWPGMRQRISQINYGATARNEIDV